MKTICQRKTNRIDDVWVFQCQWYRRARLRSAWDIKERIEKWQRSVVQYTMTWDSHRHQETDRWLITWSFQLSSFSKIWTAWIVTVFVCDTRLYQIKKMMTSLQEQKHRERYFISRKIKLDESVSGVTAIKRKSPEQRNIIAADDAQWLAKCRSVDELRYIFRYVFFETIYRDIFLKDMTFNHVCQFFLTQKMCCIAFSN